MNQILEKFQRHPVPVEAFFDFALAMTFALPKHLLESMLSPGLELDTQGDHGFLTIAMVQTKGLRPAGLPAALGQDFFLSGYRIFTRYRSNSYGTLRGLQILRSDTDRRRMVLAGNLFTGYNYHLAKVTIQPMGDVAGTLDITIRSDDGTADVSLAVNLHQAAEALPQGSPFASLAEARRYAGPMPYTFGYLPATASMVLIHGTRREWHPQLVDVQLREATFFQRPHFAGSAPILAASFCVSQVPYRWESGTVEKLTAPGP